MVHSLTWKLLSNKFKKMPTLREDDTNNNNDNVDDDEEESNEANAQQERHDVDKTSSVNDDDDDDEEEGLDSQLTVKTDNTSKNEEEEDVIDSQLTVKTDNTSKSDEDGDDGDGEGDKNQEEQTAIKDMVELDVPKDGSPDPDLNDKEAMVVVNIHDNNAEDEEDEERSSLKYETVREEENSNDSFPTSSQMLTPLEPLKQQQEEPSSSPAASSSSPLLTTQMSQPQEQTAASAATTSLLLTQMTSSGGHPSSSIWGGSQGTFLTTQMAQERQEGEEEEEEEQLNNTQGTTTSELQLGMTQSQQTTNIEGKSSQSQQYSSQHGEKPPALFVDAKDEDFIEQFASKMNEKNDNDGDKEQKEADGSDVVTEKKEDCNGDGNIEQMEAKREDNQDGSNNMSVEETYTKHIGGTDDGGNDGENKGMFFETNESDGENDDADNNGVGLLTQAANDDDDDDDDDDESNMSDVNSVRTQESQGGKASSNDGDNDNAASEDNEGVADVIEKHDIIIDVQNDNGDTDAHPPLSGLTGPSQSQSDIPTAQQAGPSQRSNGNNKHVSFQEDKQDNLDGAEKSPQVDLDATDAEKEEEEDGKDDIMDKKETPTQLDLPLTADANKEEEEGEEGAIMNKEEVAGEDEQMIDVDDDPKHSCGDEGETKVLETEEISITATSVTEKHDDEQQNAGDNAEHASDDELVEDDEPEQTGDTIITTGSNSIGWSLYDGETQQLLSGPSQILTGPSNPSKDSDPTNHEDDVEMNNDELVANSSTGANDDDVKMNLDDSDNELDTEDEYNENEPTQPFEKPKSGDADVDTDNKEDESENGDDYSLVEMKHTQENGLPSALSYPDDHVEKDRSPGKASNLDHTQNDHESQTQQSQDLLALTPVKEKRCSPKKSPARQKDNDEVVTKKTSEDDDNLATAKLTVQQKSSPKRSNDASKQAASPKKVDSKWLSSTREEASPEGSRLVFPSFKSTENPTLDTNEEEASDDEAWAGHGLHNDHPEDDIEDTQDDYVKQKKHVSLKRLPAKRSRSPSNDSSTVDETEVFEETFAPKVLRYGALAKKSEPTDTQSQSSEAEFNDNYDDDDESEVGRTAFPLSQTDEAIKRQLKEIQEMSLPSIKQLKEIASRKRMSDQNAEMRERHEQEMKALKRENTMLRNAIKEKDDIVYKRDRQLSEKNKLLNSQASVITMLKKKLDIVSTTSVEEPSSNEKPSSTKKPASTKKHTPTSNPGKKRKQRDNEVHSSDSEEDDMPLSALKGGTAKKRSAVKAQSRQTSASGSKSMSHKPAKAKAAHSVNDRNGDQPAKVKSSSTKKMPPARPLVSNDLTKYWKELEEKGWTYKTGPEPYNKVYVPKDGATHMGCQIGIHFFEADQVIPEAIRRGDLNADEHVVLPSKENDTPRATNQIKQRIDVAMDDTKLYGLVTLETARVAIDLVGRFVCGQDSAASFRGQLFDALWQRLKEQGGVDTGNNWRYEPYSSPLSLYSWCFVPPTSSLGNKGRLGEDYYVREEHLVLGVLQSVTSLSEVSGLLKKKYSAFSTVMPILVRAVDNNMSYEDARDGKDPTVRSRRARVLDSPVKSEKVKSSRKKSPRQPKVSSIAEAALISSKKKPIITRKTPDKKRSRTVSPNTGSGKKQKTEETEHISPSFHMDQTQTQVPVPSYERRNPSSSSGPLSGYTFMCSGVNRSVNERIKKLGGELAAFESLNRSNSCRKLFFLSDHQCWRKPKYVYAVALGAPMLHIDWLSRIEEKYEENGEVTVFNSSLYVQHRLPTGLDLFQRSYTLQRASHARDWVRPGGRDTDGRPTDIFEGMTIALALGAEEKTW